METETRTLARDLPPYRLPSPCVPPVGSLTRGLSRLDRWQLTLLAAKLMGCIDADVLERALLEFQREHVDAAA